MRPSGGFLCHPILCITISVQHLAVSACLSWAVTCPLFLGCFLWGIFGAYVCCHFCLWEQVLCIDKGC